MKAAIINTPVLQTVESHDLPDYPHAGIGYLSEYLKSKGIECDVIDAKLLRLSVKDVVRRIKENKYDIIGISAMTHDIAQAENLARAVKKLMPNIKIIIGGVHATALPKQTLEDFPHFDYLIHGEGEITMYELAKAIEAKKGFDKVLGIAYRKGKKVIVNPPGERVENLDELPFPDYSQFPRCPEYHITTSRGCPYNCVFCMSPYGRKKIRERSPQKVIEELKIIDSYHPKVIKFNDETFGFNKPRAMELLDLIIKNNLHHTKKIASLRANHVDLELLKKMKEAGFYMVDYGIESGNAEILKRIKKGVTLEQTELAVKLTKQAGIKVGANYIIGHPGETWETAMQTINYAVKLNGDVNAIGLMVPYPGTEIATMAEKGEWGYKVLSHDWKDYNKQLGNALELKTLSRKQMEKLQLIGYVKILLWNFRILDFIRFCWEYRRAGIAFLKKFFTGKVR